MSSCKLRIRSARLGDGTTILSSNQIGAQSSMDHASKGLLKLMVRLPALRGDLQVLHAHDPTLRELVEAYADATRTLDQLRLNPRAETRMVKEYEGICSGLEDEVVERCFISRRQ